MSSNRLPLRASSSQYFEACGGLILFVGLVLAFAALEGRAADWVAVLLAVTARAGRRLGRF